MMSGLLPRLIFGLLIQNTDATLRDVMFLSVSRHGIKLPGLDFCDGESAAAGVTTVSGQAISDSEPVNTTCSFWRSYYNDPVNKAKTGVYAQLPGGLATQGVTHAEWIGFKLYNFLRAEAPNLNLSKISVAAHDEPRVIATAESVAKGFCSQGGGAAPSIFKSQVLDTVMDEGNYNIIHSDTIPAACRLASEAAVVSQIKETYNRDSPSEYFFRDGDVPIAYSVEGFGLICEHLDLSCHLDSFRRRLNSLVLDYPGGALQPAWGGGYWATFSSGLPAVDAKYMGLLLVQR
jgi:hypothetical protein